MYIRNCITITNRENLIPQSLELICVGINKPTVRASRSWFLLAIVMDDLIREPTYSISLSNFLSSQMYMYD